MKKFVFILLVLLSLVITGKAEAVPVSFNFSGYIDTVNIYDTNSLVGSTVNTISPWASTFSGAFSYDTSTSASVSGPNFAFYPAGSFSILVDGTYSFAGNAPEAFVLNDDPFDRLGLQELISLTSTVLADYMFLALTDSTNSVFSSTALPGSINLADFPHYKGIIISNDSLAGLGNTPDSYQIFGTITSVTAVPEPSTFFLLGLGLVGLLVLLGTRQAEVIK